MTDLEKRIEVLEAKLKLAADALEPVRHIVDDSLKDTWTDDDRFVSWSRVTFGDLRRAAQTLRELRGEEK